MEFPGRTDCVFVSLQFGQEVAPDLRRPIPNQLRCFGFHHTVRFAIRDDVDANRPGTRWTIGATPAEPADGTLATTELHPGDRLLLLSKEGTSSDPFLDSRTVHCICPRSPLLRLLGRTEHVFSQGGFLAITQIKMARSVAHAFAPVNLAILCDPEAYPLSFPGSDAEAFMIGLDAADVVALSLHHSLPKLFEHVECLRSIPLSPTATEPLIVDSVTTICVRNFAELDSTDSAKTVRATINAQLQNTLYTDFLRDRRAHLTFGFFDYAMESSVGSIQADFESLFEGGTADEASSARGRLLTSTAILWNRRAHAEESYESFDHYARAVTGAAVAMSARLQAAGLIQDHSEPSDGASRQALRAEIGTAFEPFWNDLPRQGIDTSDPDYSCFSRLSGKLLAECWSLFTKLLNLSDLGVIPGSRPIRYTTDALLRQLRYNLEELADYRDTLRDGASASLYQSPIWLSRQTQLQIFVGALRRELEKRFASSLSSHSSYNAESYTGTVKLIGALEGASRIYASTLQYLHCASEHRFLSVISVETSNSTGGTSFRFASFPRSDNPAGGNLNLSITYIHPDIVQNSFGLALFHVLHEYNQCVLLELRGRNSFTSLCMNVALVDLVAARLFRFIAATVEAAPRELGLPSINEDDVTAFRFLRDVVCEVLTDQLRVRSSFSHVLYRYFENVSADGSSGLPPSPGSRWRLGPGAAADLRAELGHLYSGSEASITAADEQLGESLVAWLSECRFLESRIGPSAHNDVPESSVREAVRLWVDARPAEELASACDDPAFLRSLLVGTFVRAGGSMTGSVLPPEIFRSPLVRDAVAAYAEMFRDVSDFSERTLSEEILELASSGLLLLLFEPTQGALVARLCAYIAAGYHLSTEHREQPEELLRNYRRWLTLALAARLEHKLTNIHEIFDYALAEEIEWTNAIFRRALEDYRDEDLSRFSRATKEVVTELLDRSSPANRRLRKDLTAFESRSKIYYVLRILRTFRNTEVQYRAGEGQLDSVVERVRKIQVLLARTMTSYFQLDDADGNGFYDLLCRLWAMQYSFQNPFGNSEDLMSPSYFDRFFGDL